VVKSSLVQAYINDAEQAMKNGLPPTFIVPGQFTRSGKGENFTIPTDGVSEG